MVALVLRHRFDAEGSKVDRRTALALEKSPVDFEPARFATSRQEAVGDDDIRLPAGCRQRPLGDEIAVACNEDRPGAPLAGNCHRTEFGTTVAGFPLR